MRNAKSARIAALTFVVGILYGIPGLAAPDRVPFDELWRRLSAESPAVRSAENAALAAESAAARSARHWWPRLFAEGRAFTTNDAGTILFSKLGTRTLLGSDLSPFAMNHPGEASFQRATLGAELPLFEGGARVATAAFHEKAAEARGYEKRALLVKQYSEAATEYGAILVSEEHEAELRPIGTLVAQTISNYELGAKGNPVGYSGLLGLRNLRYRIEGELEMIRAQRLGARQALAARAGLPSDWVFEPVSVREFVSKYLEKGRGGLKGDMVATYGESGQSVMADGLRRLKTAERARFLPRAALFAEGSLSNGNGSSSTAYTAGGYLQWELFSAPNFGAVRQAELTAAAAEAGVDAIRLEQKTALEKATLASGALKDQLQLAEKSLALLEEQARAARKLFLNGSINALQLTEVFSRYVDLISAKAQMNTAFLNTEASTIQVVPFEIPIQGNKAEGVSK